MEPTVVFVVGSVVLLYVAALGYAIWRIHQTPELNRLERHVWTAAVVLFPFVGSLVWFVAGPHPLGVRLGDSELR